MSREPDAGPDMERKRRRLDTGAAAPSSGPIVSVEAQCGEDSVVSPWSCPLCTLDNSAISKSCEVCNTPRDFDASTLKVLTWNIAECVASAVAPAAWKFVPDSSSAGMSELAWFLNAPQQRLSEKAAAAIKDTILLHDADVICLQESPTDTWGDRTFGDIGYTTAGTANSHCGRVTLLYKSFLEPIATVVPTPGPTVAVRLALPGKAEITVASSHLEPFKEGAAKRRVQLAAVAKAMPTQHYVLCGDMNMRNSEDDAMEALDGGLRDAWKAAGSPKDAKMTWNSKINKYHQDGFGFICRFDRIYLKGEVLRVKKFALVGEQPYNGREGHYLSDHFGLVTVLGIK